ncbi:MAG TPA: regulatory protein RecX, partial [Candidatus Eisenbacteria bacterium]|nr:regulatory protein RecX [Candidatus Eisenbacteria bacterium]
AAGDALDAKGVRELNQAADEEAAYRTLLRTLERRSFAVAELRRTLVRKGHPKDAVEAALGRALRTGLLDDAAFAARFVQTRTERGRGPLRIRRDLMALGVDTALIERALDAALPEDHDPQVAAEALARKRLAQLRDLPPTTRLRRVTAYLGRRGFIGRAVTDMVRRVIHEHED